MANIGGLLEITTFFKTLHRLLISTAVDFILFTVLPDQKQ